MIRREIVKRLSATTGPANLKPFYSICFSQAKMHDRLICGHVALCAGQMPRLPRTLQVSVRSVVTVRRFDEDRGADSPAVRFLAL